MLFMHSYIVEQTLLPISVFILHLGLMIKHKKYERVHVCVFVWNGKCASKVDKISRICRIEKV